LFKSSLVVRDNVNEARIVKYVIIFLALRNRISKIMPDVAFMYSCNSFSTVLHDYYGARGMYDDKCIKYCVPIHRAVLDFTSSEIQCSGEISQEDDLIFL
jgi:hypothetical protein